MIKKLVVVVMTGCFLLCGISFATEKAVTDATEKVVDAQKALDETPIADESLSADQSDEDASTDNATHAEQKVPAPEEDTPS